MKVTLKAFLFFAAVPIILVSCSSKEKENPLEQVIVNAEMINLRDSGYTKANIIDKIKKKTILNVIDFDSSSNWYKVTYNDKTGFAYGEFVKEFKPKSSWVIFKENFLLSLIVSAIGLSGLKYKVADGRFSKGYRDGASRFGVLSIILLSILLGLAYGIFSIYAK